VFAHLPNLISTARLLCVPVLLALAWQRREGPFEWLLLAALLSDIADGWIARRFGLSTALGAMLDSIADALLMLTGAIGVWVFRPDFVREHGAWILLVLGLWALEMLLALWRYGRLSSFHTYAVRAGAYALGIFVMVLLLFGFEPWSFAFAVAINVLAYCEELVIVWLLPQWTPDVKGVYWILRARGGRAGK
jgi:cardiolipin synthase (CMP-forming)